MVSVLSYGQYDPRYYALVTLCPAGRHAPVDNMPRWTKCPGGQNAPVDILPTGAKTAEATVFTLAFFAPEM